MMCGTGMEWRGAAGMQRKPRGKSPEENNKASRKKGGEEMCK